MNRRQKKKAYKKKYGHNPPKTEAKYYGKEWGRIIARTMETVAESIRTAIPVIRDSLEKFARATRETTERIKTMPEDEFLRFLDNLETEGAKAMARQIIQDYTAAGQITPQGMNTAIKNLQAALTICRQQQALVIANAATAAVIRKNFDREEVEIIISPAVETLTAYVVQDEELKQQLLQSIDKRGY